MIPIIVIIFVKSQTEDINQILPIEYCIMSDLQICQFDPISKKKTSSCFYLSLFLWKIYLRKLQVTLGLSFRTTSQNVEEKEKT